MKVTSVICSQCGAPLQCPVGQTDSKCEYCGSTVRFTESSAVDKGLHPPTPTDDSQSQEFLNARYALNNLDQEWLLRRQKFLRYYDVGVEWIPTQRDAVFVSGLFGAIGVIFLAGSFLNTIGGLIANLIYGGMGLLSLLIALSERNSISRSARLYKQNHDFYRQKRIELMRHISLLSRSS